jgi:hypothetical protein
MVNHHKCQDHQHLYALFIQLLPILINDWYLDSGATHQLTYHGEWFLTYFPIYPRELVYLGDNTL